ncbi:DUF4097 family beta strand repeat-containing protein [Lysinibacillus sp. NPDC047702]|uniref:DUF4097 family beta strand repeat-containing protein n=1 Tax=unclassified Lysinibacillus TaxID=2636778 RepID=UPI003D05E922
MKKGIIASLLIISIAVVVALKASGQQDYANQQSFNAKQIDVLEINNESWNVELVGTTSKKLSIAVDGKQQKKQNAPVDIKKDGNKISIHQFDTDDGVLKNISIGKKGTIQISIPPNTLRKIEINSSDGDITINTITAQEISILNNSGTKIIKELSAERGKITSQDGELKITDSSFKELTIAAANGDSYITSVSSPQMNITSTSGEIVLNEMNEEKALFIESGSGDIRLSYSKAPRSLELIAKSESSDITINLKDFKKVKGDSTKWKIGEASNRVEAISKEGVISIN